jgi:hypothetical protein
VQGLYLVVSDIEAGRAELLARGAVVSELFHDGGGVFHHEGTRGRLSGLVPGRHSYGAFATFSDPDGNGWLLQEVTARLPGHVSSDDTTFSSPIELADALRRAPRDPAGRFVGMHIDTWDDRATGVAGNRNRLCINFGPEDRSFHFLDTPVPEMREALADALDVHSAADSVEVRRRFMHRFPNYPVNSAKSSSWRGLHCTCLRNPA